MLAIVPDTNVLVSGLAYPRSNPGKILTLWRDRNLRVVLSRFILEEMARVLPRLSRIELSAVEIEELVNGFLLRAQIVEPSETEDLSLRDAADQKILGTWRASDADFLVTGDKDLLALAHRYPIVTPAEFLARGGV